MAVAKAKEEGSDAIICASTGNTSAAAAAYAARAGMRCVVVIPEGKIAMGKLAQAVMYGAEVVSIEGNFDQALAMVRKISETEPITLVNSVNPYRLEGQKTAAFEICDQLEGLRISWPCLWAMPAIFLPIGKDLKNTMKCAALAFQKYTEYRLKVQRLSFITVCLKIPKRSPQPSESEILRAGI